MPKTHGLSSKNRKLYNVWKAMRQRCNNPTCKDYPHYGGRGIQICEEWDDFENFYLWAVRNGYKEGLTIERKDVNKGYNSENCTWMVNEKQSRNRTDTVKYEYQGKMCDIRELSEISGIPYLTLKGRLFYYGWSVERAMTEEVFIGKNQTYKGSR
uniref:HNH endonuclease n=1 Tax=Klebsiella phage phiYH65 TaxID=3237693 RepID=A0AB39ACE1_9CAUD